MHDAEIPSLDELFDDLTNHPSPRIQEQASWVMVDHYPAESMSRLIDLIENPNPAIYRAAVKALGLFGLDALGPLCNKYRSSENPTVRACCIKAFVQVSAKHPDQVFTDNAMKVLEDGLSDDDPVVSQSAVMAIAQVGKQSATRAEALPLLLNVSRGDNTAHAISAIMALGEINNIDANQALEDLINDTTLDPIISEIAKSSLERSQMNRPKN